jgi:hypothetical protein
VACAAPVGKLPERELDDEGRRSGKAVVLPVGGRPGRPADGAVRLPRQTRVAPGGGAAPAPRAHDRLRLVVPDGHVGPHPPDQVACDPSLPLGPRPRSRVLRVPPLADRDPLGAEIAVQVDAAGVLPDAEPVSVAVEVVDDPEIEAGREGSAGESAGDLAALALVPVDAADDEDPPRAGEVTVAVHLDRAALVGAADHLMALVGGYA